MFDLGRMTRDESLEEIIFSVMAVEIFSSMKNKYKGTTIGFNAEECHKAAKNELMKMIKKHEKEFGDKLDMKILRKL